MGKMKAIAQELFEQGFERTKQQPTLHRKYSGDGKVGHVWVKQDGTITWSAGGVSTVDNLSNVIKLVESAVER